LPATRNDYKLFICNSRCLKRLFLENFFVENKENKMIALNRHDFFRAKFFFLYKLQKLVCGFALSENKKVSLI